MVIFGSSFPKDQEYTQVLNLTFSLDSLMIILGFSTFNRFDRLLFPQIYMLQIIIVFSDNVAGANMEYSRQFL